MLQCKEFPCQESEACENFPGSHKCYCHGEKNDNGVCQLPADYVALQDMPVLEIQADDHEGESDNEGESESEDSLSGKTDVGESQTPFKVIRHPARPLKHHTGY